MKCISSLLVVSALLFSVSAMAKPPEEKVVKADTPEKFELLVTAIQQEMAPGKRYEFLNKGNRRVINDSFERMTQMLTAAGSVDAMSPEQKARLFSIQEEVNGLLAKNSDERLVCTHSSPTGSHIPMTTCHTVREIANSKAASKDQMHDITNRENAYYQAIGGSGG